MTVKELKEVLEQCHDDYNVEYYNNSEYNDQNIKVTKYWIRETEGVLELW